MSETRHDLLEELVAECLFRREEGVLDLPYDEICREAPELVDEVQQSVELALGLPRLQASGPAGDKLVGTLLSERYSVYQRIGSGAMGVVYGARDLDLGREVAIKVVHTGLLDRSKALSRFEREAAALAAIRHDSVVTIFDRGVTEDGLPFLVMERIDGVSCSEPLEAAERYSGHDDSSWLTEEFGIQNVAEPSYFRQVVQWAAGLASGLEAAHAAGVYHRDVKRSNVMITREGKAVLIDFGIAAKDDHATLTQTDAAVGTPVYMAPEALLGRTKAMPTQDVYSLTATLYHILTFQAPYTGSSAKILTALATREPVPAFKIRPGLPRDAQAILDHGLERNPARRYASAAAMERDLRALLAYRQVSVRPTSSFVRSMRRVRSSKAFVGAALASLVIFGALGLQSWNTSLANDRHEAFKAAMPHVPANLGIVIPQNRVIADEDLRAGARAALDRLVAAGHDPVTERTLRAAFLLDHGDAQAATADMKIACSRAGTSYASELYRRYEALPVDSSSALDLNLTDLPEPKSADDVYLSAFHSLRQLNRDGLGEVLGDPRLSRNRHAQELLLLCKTPRLTQLPDRQARLGFADSFVEEVKSLEARTGYRSAMTAHLLGIAYLRTGQDERALNMALEGAQLAPSSGTILLNAGSAAYGLSNYELARTFLEAGLRLHPHYVSLQQLLGKVEAEAGHIERARALVREAGFPDSPLGAMRRAILGAKIELSAALEFAESDAEESRAAAEASLRYCQLLSEDSVDRVSLERDARAFLDGDASSLLDSFILRLCEDPQAVAVLEDLLKCFPEQFSASQTQSLRRWVEALVERLVVNRRSYATSDAETPWMDPLRSR
ncbi:Serine/threonine-protein kinase PknB [Planctomycetes bacterium Poly30]|uniref:Serine/threonine-protein kinase PknB n=1 Tax=Saltatorellus ferox TaxID=2528018 RepID=A0A518EM18_9BACT|nr:Serine/threonine-protein kinase PknB [Planctomycetes bacterium Poly30]